MVLLSLLLSFGATSFAASEVCKSTSLEPAEVKFSYSSFKSFYNCDFIENEADELVISKQKHQVIARIFKNAKATILGETNSSTTNSDYDDILNLL